jgi:hypothetical protein
MPAADLYIAASDLLTSCIDLLDWTDRAYVSNGLPAFDCCPQLTVHAGPFNRDLVVPTPGSPSPSEAIAKRTTRGNKNRVPLVVTVLRCVPTLKQSGKSTVLFPDPADLSASAAEMMGDVWILWNGLQRLTRDALLFADVENCRCVDFGPATPVSDQGGCGGWTLVVTVQLDGSEV